MSNSHASAHTEGTTETTAAERQAQTSEASRYEDPADNRTEAPMTPVDMIRDTLAELATMTPDEIAGKLHAEGMLWYDATKGRSMSCPIHHLLTARLAAAGLSVVILFVGRLNVFVDGGHYWVGFPRTGSVDQFINRFDGGVYA